jgi:small conductance mechanosensitive channel
MFDPNRAWRSVESMVDGWIAALPNLIIAVLVFLVFLTIARQLRSVVHRFTDRKHGNAGLVMGRLTEWAVLTAGTLVALSIVVPSFHASDLVQLLGVTGVAIGFAFRDILQNFLAGLLILLAEPFRIGDEIRVKEFTGTVEDIQTRATLIRTDDGQRIVIPNASLFTESVTVKTAFETRRSQLDVLVHGDADVASVLEQLRADVQAVQGVASTPQVCVAAVELTEPTIRVRVFWWVQMPYEQERDVANRVLMALRKRLTSLKITEAS